MTDYLDEIQARADAATDGPWFGSGGGRHVFGATPGDEVAVFGRRADADFIAHARTDVPRLVAALRAVEALHEPIEYVDGTGCAVCGYPFRIHDGTIAGTLYPCPTVTAIRGALEP